MTSAISALGLWQNNISPGDQHSLASLSNGQFFFQKPDGLLQYFVEVGAYTMPSLGTPYVNTPQATGDYFGPLPVAYLSLAPSSTFSIEAGKLPTLIGAGYTFSFKNPNIEHGLLWNQEPAINRGGQLNYTTGPLALSFSWNDGFYSNRYTWLTGSATYTLDNANRFALAAGGNYSHTAKSTLATPLFQNNETILDLVYIHIAKPWAFATGFQYTHVPAIASTGALTSASIAGGGMLLNYSFGDGSPLAGVSLPVRLEYISSTGSFANGSPNLLYGPGSNAWSITVTPTYQYKIFFARVEFSHVGQPARRQDWRSAQPEQIRRRPGGCLKLAFFFDPLFIATVLKNQQIQFRIGVNVGDVIVVPDDIYGHGVSLPVRLESLASPGEICISAEALRQVRGAVAAEFAVGEQRLKSIVEPAHVFALSPAA